MIARFSPSLKTTVTTATVETVTIESDERGFELLLTDDEGYVFVFNIHAVAGDLLEQARSEISEWYMEWKAREAEHELEREDPDAGYDRDDPKHPKWPERMTS